MTINLFVLSPQFIRDLLARFNRKPISNPITKPALPILRLRRSWIIPNDSGYATNIHAILDQLPTYFSDMKVLRKFDPDAYDTFATLGGCIVDNTNAKYRLDTISSDFLEKRPHLRCIFLPWADAHEDETKTTVKVVYLLKMAPCQVCVTRDEYAAVPSSGDTYSLTGVWVNRKSGRKGGERCFINIAPDGTLTILPQKQIMAQKIRLKRKKRGEHSSMTIHHSMVGVPQWLATIGRDNNCSVEEVVTEMVALAAASRRPENAILVRASHGSMTCTWAIPRTDSKRFFAARDTGLADDGRRKRVLHYVAPFTRANGQFVRAHFRGERCFDWNGYKIEISGLGFHHTDFYEFSGIHAYEIDEEDTVDGKQFLTMKQAAEKVRKIYNKPVFLSKTRKHRSQLEQL